MISERLIFPISRCRTLEDFREFHASTIASERNATDNELLASHSREAEWTVPGWSILANQNVEFIVDPKSGGYELDGIWHPNLRERLVCPVTGLNNRQRLICSLVLQESIPGARIWFMEQVTPVYAWAKATLQNAEIIGSEFLGPAFQPGTISNGIRHEDCERLSFADGSLDMIVSNEVFEHVPNPYQGFSECARVLAPLGRMIATIPFMVGTEKSVTRAIMKQDGSINYLLEAVYHGNPMSEDGSLVFTDFGWEVMETIKNCGFRSCYFDFYHAPASGHYGDNLMVLMAIR